MSKTLAEILGPEDKMPWGALASLALSVIILFGGMFWTYGIWRETNQKFHELYHVNETLQGLRTQLGMQEARVR